MKTLLKNLIISMIFALFAVPAHGALRPGKWLLGSAATAGAAIAWYKKDDVKQTARAVRGKTLDEVAKRWYPEEFEQNVKMALSLNKSDYYTSHPDEMWKIQFQELGNEPASAAMMEAVQKAKEGCHMPKDFFIAVCKSNREEPAVALHGAMWVREDLLNPKEHMHILCHELVHIKHADWLNPKMTFREQERRAELEGAQATQCAQCAWGAAQRLPSFFSKPIRMHFRMKLGYLSPGELGDIASQFHKEGKYCDWHKDCWWVHEPKPIDYVAL